MPKKFVNLPQPTNNEILRIREIQFYWLIKNLEKNLEGTKIQAILQGFCVATETKITLVEFAADLITKGTCLPSKEQQSIALGYLQIPIRTIKKEFIHQKTYYNNIYNYSLNRQMNPLVPTLPTEITEEITLFIIKLNSILSNSFEFLSKGITYYD